MPRANPRRPHNAAAPALFTRTSGGRGCCRLSAAANWRTDSRLARSSWGPTSTRAPGCCCLHSGGQRRRPARGAGHGRCVGEAEEEDASGVNAAHFGSSAVLAGQASS